MNCFLLLLIFLFQTVECHIVKQETPILHFLKEMELSHLNSGIDGIDCIYIINLDERVEKWLRVDQLLKQLGCFPNRFSAINGWKLTDEERQQLAGPYHVRVRGGHTGCYLSHVSVLMDAYKRGFNRAWIMEDDIEVLDDLKKIPKLLNQLEKIDPEWDILYTDLDTKDHDGKVIPALGTAFRPDQKGQSIEELTKRTKINKNLVRLGQRYGLYSYILSKRGIKKAIDYFTHVYLWTAVDIDIHYVPNIREYASTKEIVSIWCESTISDTLTPIK